MIVMSTELPNQGRVAMDKVRILFVKDKYYAGNPDLGLSNTESILVETLEDTGLVQNVKLFYFDELSQKLGQPLMGEQLLAICAATRPDLVIFAPLGWPTLDPSRQVVNLITNTLGIKVYMIRFDSIGGEGDRFTQSWFPFVSSIGFMDSTLAHLGYSQNPKAIKSVVSFNAKCFYDSKLKRDIDVSFVGSISNWPHRAEYIDFLRKNGINVITRGGQRFDFVPFEEYSKLINRSKISLSFCLNGNGFSSQLKTRVFEITACNTCLVEDAGIETKELFQPGKDFIMVNGKQEMLEAVQYYLEHDEEREIIAQSGYRKATQLYNSKNVWGYVLSKMGFNLPDSFTSDRYYQELCQKFDSL